MSISGTLEAQAPGEDPMSVEIFLPDVSGRNGGHIVLDRCLSLGGTWWHSRAVTRAVRCLTTLDCDFA